MKVLNCVLALALSLSCLDISAQNLSVSTDFLDWAALGTINGEASYSLKRHWGLTADIKYNPFSFNSGNKKKSFQARQKSYSIGARYWPWHIFSGWWFSGKLRYQEYNTGGIVSKETFEGDRYGTAAGLGYTYMLTSHLNIEFGAGLWTGYESYTKYECPVCGPVLDKGKKFFFLPSDVMIALAYVF